MTYPEAVKFLYELQLFGSKLGLENTFKLAELAGNPQNKLRFMRPRPGKPCSGTGKNAKWNSSSDAHRPCIQRNFGQKGAVRECAND